MFNFLTSIEAAHRLHISESHLRRSRVEDLLGGRPAPQFIKVGSKVLYSEEDLLDWLREIPRHRNTSTV